MLTQLNTAKSLSLLPFTVNFNTSPASQIFSLYPTLNSREQKFLFCLCNLSSLNRLGARKCTFDIKIELNYSNNLTSILHYTYEP